jgi:hypothetical protein
MEVPGKFKGVIPEAQKVSGHMREGQRNPREVPQKSREVPGNSQETQEMTQEPRKPTGILAKMFRQAIQVKLKPMLSC